MTLQLSSLHIVGKVSARLRMVRGASLPIVSVSALMLAGCANQAATVASNNGYYGAGYDPRLGVWASPRVVGEGEPVPKGGGSYLVGRPYRIAGRQYVPREIGRGYSVVGTASWYGDAFHGRRTANGEIFDKGSISAAHPTLPLPSYVRVTNLANHRSMIVRVNDRGPYHGGRVMDVSQRVAELLDFRRAGTGHIKVDYIGKAGLRGDDEERLAGTLRTDGQLAQLDGMPSEPVQDVASNDDGQVRLPPHFPLPEPAHIALVDARAAIEGRSVSADGTVEDAADAPLPPSRPFDVAALPVAGNQEGRGSGPRRHARGSARSSTAAE
jgi:rare lipoprotein A